MANTADFKDNYKMLGDSIMNAANWGKDMKYLVPALSIYLMTATAKQPQYAQGHMDAIKQIVEHLINPQMRCEKPALQIASIVFEKLGSTFDQGQFLHSCLLGIFTSLHFYRNNTKSKVIPKAIMSAVHVFFATYMVYTNSAALTTACDKI